MSEQALNAHPIDDGADGMRPGEHSWPGDLTTVDTRFGVFAAVDDGEVTRIRNIRYAVAERFAPPVPVEPDPREASARQYQRLGCPQPPASSDGLFGGTMRGVEFDEDCLRLSITRPADWAGEALPVMVWVHGGSYVSGAGDVGGYDPAALVREQRVVVVTITYRLGVLGFLGGGDPGARPANLGLLDLVEALRWVRFRIDAFGGDPGRVTVFGQSAGADAIAHLLVASGAEGLVNRAIVQSAPFGIRQRRRRLQERMRRAAGPLAPDAALDELFAAQDRAARAAAGFGLRSGMPFSPQYGHAPLPLEREVAAGWRRRAPELEVLVTSTTEEAAFFLELAPKLKSLTSRRVIGPPTRFALVRLVTSAVYTRGARRFARLLARGGGRVQVARFDGRPEGSRIGSAHAIELALLFPNAVAWAPARLLAPHGAESLVEAGAPLRAAWGEFARTGRIVERHVRLGRGWRGGLRVR
ncbi:para-nitrobenzyl esterase [Agromyces sp. 3263]|uniref:carboxylesterase family protein n=1 Tax=Agromyces sp. 3263 TaxID=2817750 RepID=UPI002859366E|nr:carboxylesterase family protein [Agromyces sp. 3263]MDR6905151.1 para-nitrobenzyl esterase [Agromyces sp. 3263]